MIVLTKLILAHLLGDFLLQPTKWVQEKEEKKAASGKLYIHVLIHGLLILLLLGNMSLWPLALMIALSHLIIDLAKLYYQKKETKALWFFADQTLHLMVLLVSWYLWFTPERTLFIQSLLPEIWIYLTASFFLTIPAGIIIKLVLSRWEEKISIGQTESLADAGKYIGILERFFVFLFIVTDHWESVGFLIAAKSVFRFGDLKGSKDREFTEYILIGTLLSFGTAILIALLTVAFTALM
jgi:hypothetical protein